jgi:hypothetical protein
MPRFGLLHTALRWLPSYALQLVSRRAPSSRPLHVMLAIANHFEPEFMPGAPGRFASFGERERRVESWCRRYPEVVDSWRDADGQPLRQTYFYPAEHYDVDLIERLASHARQGWGEVEVHLHHGVNEPDTTANTRAALLTFRDRLAAHGCLAYQTGSDQPRYAFVHGNWALANSGGGRFCGVNDELQLLADTGCYADFTLPSAPDRSQISKINALYECRRPLSRRAAHRWGRDLRAGHPPKVLPLIIQGPLWLSFARRPSGGPRPFTENGALTASAPPSLSRFRDWTRPAIRVEGRKDWIFVKLHCHGMDPRDTPTLVGDPMANFLRELTSFARISAHVRLHFVTAREMTNIALAACDGLSGDPGSYRDYRFLAKS